MARKFVLFNVFFVLAVLFAACSPKPVKLTAAERGGSVTVNAGQQFTITLDGNPSTGYTWEPKDLDASMFQQVGDAQFISDNTGLVGAGGTLTLTFKALKTGSTDLTLVYHRPWEKDVAPVDTYTVTVVVK
jgi:inhibitor of cysteine peptidase